MTEIKESRCDCGKLLFKRTRHGFEFKCNRCKRVHLIPMDWFSTEYRNLCPIIDQSNLETDVARDPNESNARSKRKEKVL